MGGVVGEACSMVGEGTGRMVGVEVAVGGGTVTEAGTQAVNSASTLHVKISTCLPLIFMDSFYPNSTKHYIIYKGLTFFCYCCRILYITEYSNIHTALKELPNEHFPF